MKTRSKPLLRIAGDTRGSAVLETALILPVLLTLAFGFIDLTQAFAYKMTMQEHAQAGADVVVAYGESVPSDAEIKQAVSDYSGLPTTSITIVRTFDCNGKSASTTANSCPNASDLRVDYLKITVQGTYKPMVNFKGYSDFVPSGKISQSATVRLS